MKPDLIADDHEIVLEYTHTAGQARRLGSLTAEARNGQRRLRWSLSKPTSPCSISPCLS